jgi:plastocyanin
MNRTMIVIAVAGAALALAAPATSHEGGALLIIRHQTRGCHAWSLNNGAYKASQIVTLKRGTHLEVGNNDVMPHKLVKVAGPAVKFVPGAMMNSVGEMTEIRFTKAGVYRFTTKAGEDYTKGIKTVGEDNVLTLKVTVR